MEDDVKIAVMTLRLHAPWVHSLKEKRMIVIGVAAIVSHNTMADSLQKEFL